MAAAPLLARRLRAAALLCCAAAACGRLPRAVAEGPVPCTRNNAVSCFNGGVCLEDPVVGTYCHCPAGLVGTLCEARSNASLTPCADGLLVNYCTNNGTCPASNTTYCDCSTVPIAAGGATFRGAHCEYPAVQCPAQRTKFCYNGGTCTTTASGTALCDCASAPGWAGGSCQKRLDTSAPAAPPAPLTATFTPCTALGLRVTYCYNNGTCPTSSTAVCNCSSVPVDAAGNTGTHCEVPAVRCANNPSLFCRNGGTCYDTASGTTLCRCPAEWAGGLCESPLSASASDSAPQPPAAAPAPPSNTVAVPKWVAAPIIVGIVLIFALAGFICFMAARERKGAPVFQKLPEGGPTRRQELSRRMQVQDPEH